MGSDIPLSLLGIGDILPSREPTPHLTPTLTDDEEKIIKAAVTVPPHSVSAMMDDDEEIFTALTVREDDNGEEVVPPHSTLDMDDDEIFSAAAVQEDDDSHTMDIEVTELEDEVTQQSKSDSEPETGSESKAKSSTAPQKYHRIITDVEVVELSDDEKKVQQVASGRLPPPLIGDELRENIINFENQHYIGIQNELARIQNKCTERIKDKIKALRSSLLKGGTDFVQVEQQCEQKQKKLETEMSVKLKKRKADILQDLELNAIAELCAIARIANRLKRKTPLSDDLQDKVSRFGHDYLIECPIIASHVEHVAYGKKPPKSVRLVEKDLKTLWEQTNKGVEYPTGVWKSYKGAKKVITPEGEVANVQATDLKCHNIAFKSALFSAGYVKKIPQ